MFRRKLSVKIIAFVILAATTNVGLVGYITFSFSKNFLEETAVERYTQLSSETLAHINKYLYEREKSVRLLADSHTPKHFLTELSELGDSPAHPIGGVIEDLDSFGIDFTVWSSVSLVDTDGVVQASSKLNLINTKFSDLEASQLEQVFDGQSYISNFKSFSDTDDISKLYVIPVQEFGLYGNDAHYVGAVVAYLPLKTIEDIALTLKHQIPEHLWSVTGIALLSSDNQVLFSAENTGYITGQSADFFSRQYRRVKQYSDTAYLYTHTTEDSKEEDIFVFHHTSDANEDFSEFKGVLSLELGAREINEPIFDIAIKPVMYILPSFLLVGSMLVSWLFFIVIRPVRHYIATIEEIRNGQTQARAKIYADDEIGRMAQNLNDLTDQLQKSNAVLEEQVQARTRDLQLANMSLEEQVRNRTRELEEANNSLEKRVSERTKELKKLKDSLEKKVTERTAELHEKIAELKSSNQLMVNRELKMIALKEEIEKLKKEIRSR